ncbi:MAG: M48 family metalloprotease [Fimbriimonas sp.]
MTWLLATLALHSPSMCGHEKGLPPRVGHIVEAAWQQQAEQEVKPPVMDPAQLPAVKSDTELGKKYSEMVEKELKLSKDEAINARVAKLGAEMAAIANSTHATATWGDKRFSQFDYKFKVVEGKDVNAFSLPGGFIYIYDGLVKYVESDSELVGVISHEIAHASFRHVATLQREQGKISSIQLPLILAAIFSGGRGGTGDLLMLGNLIGTATTSGWSVRAETAADFGGFQYMRRSKYDPTGLLTFMERLARDERTKTQVDWGIYRTHPPSRERAQAITAYMEDADLPIRRSRVTTTYATMVRPGDNGTVEVVFGGRTLVALSGTDALDRADRVSESLNDFFDDVPNLFEVTSTSEGKVLGKRKEMITLNAADAALAKLSVAEYTSVVVRNVRGALYNLAYRVWDGG